ncbi:MAG: universal stress protein, partial [Lysobacteraceae bacterium]
MHDVLVHAVGYRERDPTAAYAVRLAASLRAWLTAVHVPPAMPVVPDYDMTPVIAEYAAWVERETRDATAAAPEFESWAASMGVPNARWVVADGQVAAVLRQAGRWHDLLVIGGGGKDAWESEAGVAELVLSSGLPCLVVPRTAADGELPHACIAVAWNGSAEAIGALHAALPLLRFAGRVVMLSGKASAPAAG